MYCIGGIWCEKLMFFVKQEGIDEVYYFKGGILKYFEDVLQEESLWEGECFVFDCCVVVKYGLEEGSYMLCYVCCELLGLEDLKLEYFIFGICCFYCYDKCLFEDQVCYVECEKQEQFVVDCGQ